MQGWAHTHLGHGVKPMAQLGWPMGMADLTAPAPMPMGHTLPRYAEGILRPPRQAHCSRACEHSQEGGAIMLTCPRQGA